MKYLKDAILSIFMILKSYWHYVLIAVVLLIALLIVIRYIRAILSRLILWARLSSLCKRKKATFKAERFLLLSFFKNHSSIDFRITSTERDKTYAVKFFPLNTLRRIIYLNESENAYVSKAFMQTFQGRRGAIPGGTKPIFNYAETKLKKIKLHMPTPSGEETNILLLNPTPINVRVAKGDGFRRSSEVDGCRGYTVFDGDELINHLSRSL